ncbi:MAG: hypothetical protein OXN84_02770 [Albidovulum sp.]|nr:hypothetical protein [Albidovulum sp.]
MRGVPEAAQRAARAYAQIPVHAKMAGEISLPREKEDRLAATSVFNMLPKNALEVLGTQVLK